MKKGNAMIGILAEKPSQMRNFAKALGGQSGVYKGQSYVIAASRGHLFEFVDPSRQVSEDLAAKYKSWDLASLPWNHTDFCWKKSPRKGMADVIKELKRVLSECDEIVIATDNDPSGEGEMIGWEILDQISLKGKRISRMYFSDESVPEVQKAFENRRPLGRKQDDPDWNKAWFRSRWDLLSMQFTRVATLCGDGHSVLRQGRLKSAMVALVGKQLDEAAAYKKVPYFQNRFKDENGNIFEREEEPKFEKPELVPRVYQPSSITIDSRAIKHTHPSALPDLAAISAVLSEKGIGAATVLATYQKMYEAQIVSYPRTEDKFITPEQYRELAGNMHRIANLAGVSTNLLTHMAPRPTHVKTGCAHGANRPGPNVPASLDDLDNKYGKGAREIYLLLARKSLAMFGEDYLYEQTKAHVSRYPDFICTVNRPVSNGWKDIIGDKADEGKPIGQKAVPFIYEGVPKKPQIPTMKWLMKQLEKRDVGTGATRTSIYADVISTKAKFPLLSEKKGKLSMTAYGQMSYILLQGTNIGDLSTTEKLNAQMKDVALNRLNPEDALKEMAELVVADRQIMAQNGLKIRDRANSPIQPVSDPIQPKTADHEIWSGTWQKKTVRFKRTWGGYRFSDEECQALCRNEEITIHNLESKKGTKYGVKGHLAQLEYNGHHYVGFEKSEFIRYPAKSGIAGQLPGIWCEHVFTDEEKLALKAGQIIYVDDCISRKTGKKFSCHLKFAQDEPKGPKKLIPLFNFAH